MRFHNLSTNTIVPPSSFAIMLAMPWLKISACPKKKKKKEAE